MSNLIKKSSTEITRKGGLFGLVTQNKETSLGRPIATPDLAFQKKYLGGNKLGMLIDATASRSSTWHVATEVQNDIFRELGKQSNAKMHLVHFGGNRLADAGVFQSASAAMEAMSNVQCESGSTQIINGLDVFLQEKETAKVIVVIGDSFEESMGDLTDRVQRMKQRGAKIFAFQEGDNLAASQAFKKMAKNTGGIYRTFQKGMALKDLCSAVSIYVSSGIAGLENAAKAGDKTALKMAQDLKLLGPG